MSLVEVLFFLILASMVVLFFMWNNLGRKLCKGLKESQPCWYQELGEPNFTGSLSQLKSALVFILKSHWKKAEDYKVKEWGRTLYLVSIAYLALFLMGCTIVVLFFIDYKAIFYS